MLEHFKTLMLEWVSK